MAHKCPVLICTHKIAISPTVSNYIWFMYASVCSYSETLALHLSTVILYHYYHTVTSVLSFYCLSLLSSLLLLFVPHLCTGIFLLSPFSVAFCTIKCVLSPPYCYLYIACSGITVTTNFVQQIAINSDWLCHWGWLAHWKFYNIHLYQVPDVETGSTMQPMSEWLRNNINVSGQKNALLDKRRLNLCLGLSII